MSKREPETEPLLRFFKNKFRSMIEDDKEDKSLPPSVLQRLERMAVLLEPFDALAELIATTLPRDPERTVALRKLLEARDAVQRARNATEEEEN